MRFAQRVTEAVEGGGTAAALDEAREGDGERDASVLESESEPERERERERERAARLRLRSDLVLLLLLLLLRSDLLLFLRVLRSCLLSLLRLLCLELPSLLRLLLLSLSFRDRLRSRERERLRDDSLPLPEEACLPMAWEGRQQLTAGNPHSNATLVSQQWDRADTPEDGRSSRIQ